MPYNENKLINKKKCNFNIKAHKALSKLRGDTGY